MIEDRTYFLYLNRVLFKQMKFEMEWDELKIESNQVDKRLRNYLNTKAVIEKENTNWLEIIELINLTDLKKIGLITLMISTCCC